MTEKEFNLREKRDKTRKDINYLFDKIDWSKSFLDAQAIQIMNEFWKEVIDTDKEFIKRVKDLLKDGDYYGDRSFTHLFKEIDKLFGDVSINDKGGKS